MTIGRMAMQGDRPATGFVEDLVAAARDNPLSTVLIGMGALWMLVGGREASLLRGAGRVGSLAANGVGASGRYVGSGVSSLASAVADKTSAGFDAVADRASSLKAASAERLSDVLPDVASMRDAARTAVNDQGNNTAQQVGSLSSAARTTASRAGNQAMDQAGDLIGTLQERFSDLLHTNPLVLGAMGLAVGAGVAAALPRFAAEDALLEPISDVRDQIRKGLSGAFDRAADEARAQGLTPEALSGTVADLGHKVSEVASGSAGQTKASGV